MRRKYNFSVGKLILQWPFERRTPWDSSWQSFVVWEAQNVYELQGEITWDFKPCPL